MVDLISRRDDVERLVGWFDPAFNETRDANGRLVGRGDVLTTLLSTLSKT